MRDLPPFGVILVIYLLGMVMTEFLSNNAVAVLYTPIAIELARQAVAGVSISLVGVPETFGRGVAYGEARLEHLLNVRARDLGATESQVFWRVTLPQILPSIVSSWLLAFTLSMDDVMLAAFLSGPGATTLPLVVFARARQGLDPSVNALSTVVLAVVALGVVGACTWMARQESRRRSA